MFDIAMLHQTPFIPKNLTKTKAVGILNIVKIILIADGILGSPNPENTPFDIISKLLNIWTIPSTLK